MSGGAVQCLACGHEYAVDAGRWTVVQDCECPRCGYLGWTDADPDHPLRHLHRRPAATLDPESRNRLRSAVAGAVGLLFF